MTVLRAIVRRILPRSLRHQATGGAVPPWRQREGDVPIWLSEGGPVKSFGDGDV